MDLESLFPLGRLSATPGVIAAAEASGDNLMMFVFRHAAGDWGQLNAGDMKANAEALRHTCKDSSIDAPSMERD